MNRNAGSGLPLVVVCRSVATLPVLFHHHCEMTWWMNRVMKGLKGAYNVVLVRCAERSDIALVVILRVKSILMLLAN